MAMERASFKSIKRRLSSLSLRPKSSKSKSLSASEDTGEGADLIKAGVLENYEAGKSESLPEDSGTIAPLINGIRDIIDDQFPMPSARHVPQDLQRRLSALPSMHGSQAIDAPLSNQQAAEGKHADVLAVDERLGTAEKDDGHRRPDGNSIASASILETHAVLPSDNSLTWQLPQTTESTWQRTPGAALDCLSASLEIKL